VSTESMEPIQFALNGRVSDSEKGSPDTKLWPPCWGGDVVVGHPLLDDPFAHGAHRQDLLALLVVAVMPLSGFLGSAAEFGWLR
jgi:hypothetical protein